MLHWVGHPGLDECQAATTVTKSLQEEVTQLRIDVATLKVQLQAAKEALALTHEVSHTWLYVSAVIGWILALGAIGVLLIPHGGAK